MRKNRDGSASHASSVAPIWREYERGTSAIVDAYLKPLFGTDTRDVYFPGEGFLPTAVVRRGGLAALDRRVGPLIVDSMDSTVVVPPGWMLTTDTGGVLELERDKEQR